MAFLQGGEGFVRTDSFFCIYSFRNFHNTPFELGSSR